MTICYSLGWYKEGDSSLAKGWRFQNIIISTRGTVRHNAKNLFIVDVIVGKTYYSETLLYHTQLDYISIGYYAHKWGNVGEYHNPTFGRVWGWHSHSQNGDLGVL